MFERYTGGNKAILVHVHQTDTSKADIEEFQSLVRSTGAEIVALLESHRARIDSKTYIGKGKTETLKEQLNLTDADVVIFNHDLSPAQERNLEKLLQRRVLSRSGLILDIFAQRALTFEGKLQVELAQLQHLSTRLIRGWTHLERQKGGIGLRGPGETQLETDRRLIGERIKMINKRLKKVKAQRSQNRQARKRAKLPVVSIVGYTNAGKSSLFNQLVDDNIYAADKLFATLDPTMRRLPLPGADDIIIADTVGFIRQLPHDLVEAFSATLEETVEAELLIHVIDLSDPDWRAHSETVDEVLASIGAHDIPKITVFNKIDLLDKSEPKVRRSKNNTYVWLSANKKWGLELLKSVLSETLFGSYIEFCYQLKPNDGELRAQLFNKQAIQEEQTDAQQNHWLSLKLTQTLHQNLFSSG